MCLTLPEVLITVMGIEKLVPTLARPRGLPAAAAALVDRGADEPVHVDVDRASRPATGRRRSTSSCSTTAGPTCCPTRSGRQALRCIRCSACLNVCPVYERTGGQAYGSVYPGPDRRDPHAAAARHRPAPGRQADRVAAVRLVAVRRLLRGLPGPDRHPGGPRPPARPGRPRSPRRATGSRPAEAAAMRAAAWTFRSPRRLGLAERLAGFGGRRRRAARTDPRGSRARVRSVAGSGPATSGSGPRIVPGLVAPDRRRAGEGT